MWREMGKMVVLGVDERGWVFDWGSGRSVEMNEWIVGWMYRKRRFTPR